MTNNVDKFTAEIDEYTILTLNLKDYRGTPRTLPKAYSIVLAGKERAIYRAKEKALLRKYFVAWKKAFHGTLPGFRNDSAIFVTFNNELISGYYLCDQNELGKESWGQLHYSFVDPDHGGKGIHSVIFNEAVKRAKEWRLKGLVINTDRLMLPEVYMRWGAVPYKKIKKRFLRKIAGKIWNMMMNNYSILRRSL